jgi:hypothetical protein
VDEVPSSGVARIQIQNEELGRLKNGQYLEIDIPAEPQPLSIYFHAWPMTLNWGNLPLDPESGKVYYLRLSASPTRWRWQWDESARGSEGKRGLRFEVSLLHSFRSAEAALPELERTRLSY